MNSEIPTASTGISGGYNQGALQSLALISQLQATAGGSPLSLAAEMAAESQEAIEKQAERQKQSLLAAVQAQQQHVAAAQATLSRKLSFPIISLLSSLP